MGNEIRAWMNEPFCWDTLIAKIPVWQKGMKTSLEKLGSWLLIFLPGLMFSFYLLAAKESLLRMGSSDHLGVSELFQGKNTLSGKRQRQTMNQELFYHIVVDGAEQGCEACTRLQLSTHSGGLIVPLSRGGHKGISRLETLQVA